MSQFLTLELGFELAILPAQGLEFVLFAGRKVVSGVEGVGCSTMMSSLLGLSSSPNVRSQ